MVKARKPVRVRRVNIVSILIALAVASAIYFGWKIIPVYYEAQKVDTLLQGYRREASDIQLHKIDSREKRILEEVWQKVFGFVPEQDGGLARMLDEYAARHCGLSLTKPKKSS